MFTEQEEIEHLQLLEDEEKDRKGGALAPLVLLRK